MTACDPADTQSQYQSTIALQAVAASGWPSRSGTLKECKSCISRMRINTIYCSLVDTKYTPDILNSRIDMLSQKKIDWFCFFTCL